jgi:hypothetical protein
MVGLLGEGAFCIFPFCFGKDEWNTNKEPLKGVAKW